MSKILPKFYYLKDMTQEDLNELVLERNILASKNNVLQQRIDKAIDFINDNADYQDVHKQIGINEFIDTTEDILDEEHIKELLEILKGDNLD